ncbi:MAG: SPOR domain-containing protein [Leptospiraceae bacterium]|nr:SPOR domain-containing protein [Leptospiraceae bacterium]
MKERTFYTFNLDIPRIIIVSIVLIGIISYAFALGYSFGKKAASKIEVATANVPDKKDEILHSNQGNKNPLAEEEYNLDQMDEGETKKVVSKEPEKEKLKEPEKVKSKEPELKSDFLDLKPETPQAPKPKVKELETAEVLNPKPQKFIPPRKPKKKYVLKKIEPEEVVTEREQSAPTGNQFTMQLGAFSTREQADKFKEAVNSMQKPSNFSAYIKKNGELYVVRMGKAEERADLEKYIPKLDPKIQDKVMIVKNN